MNVTLHVIEVSGKGVMVATPASTAETFWLPRASVKWAEIPEPGATVTANLPRWLRASHSPLRLLRGQYALPLHEPVELDPIKAQERIPMANDMSGALFKNDRREKDTHPLYKGDCVINGQKYWISAWLKDGKNGKYMSLAFKPAEEKPERQRQPERGGPSFDGEPIPFEMEWR